MAGIYIPGMKMPKSCGVCKMHFLGEPDYICCQITDRIPKIVGKFHNSKIDLDARKVSIESVARPDWCPLIPVPDHGDLIDRDEYAKTHVGGEMLKFAPTVIPADREGEA